MKSTSLIASIDFQKVLPTNILIISLKNVYIMPNHCESCKLLRCNNMNFALLFLKVFDPIFEFSFNLLKFYS